MSAKDDGGPAFARAIGYGTVIDRHREPQGLEVLPQAGMSLRDYFAAKALPEAMRQEYTRGADAVALVAGKMADAMLRERAKS